MRKVIVAIFAHPDDEAFGPAGTLAKLAKDNDVYIICATKGEGGQNYLKNTTGPIEEIRANELRCSAAILGVKKVFFLGFKDGSLSNNVYHELADKIKTILDELRPQILISTELRGISGHIDHVAVAMVTSYVFYKTPYAKTLYRYVMMEQQRQMIKDYFIYVPPGYKKSEIDLTVDINGVWQTKISAMNCHKSQKKDVLRLQRRFSKLPKKENFQVVKK